MRGMLSGRRLPEGGSNQITKSDRSELKRDIFLATRVAPSRYFFRTLVVGKNAK
jgi:hypothetical protein